MLGAGLHRHHRRRLLRRVRDARTGREIWRREEGVFGTWLSYSEEHDALLAGLLRKAAAVAKSAGIDGSGYRLVSNCGRDGGQEVFHLHYHLLGGAKLGPFGQK